MKPSPDTFIWSYQKAGDDPQKMIPQGRIDFVHFSKKIDQLPWQEELMKANHQPQKAYPTLSVKNQKENEFLWVSVYGLAESFEYLIGYIFSKEIGGQSGDQARMTFWEEIYSTLDINEVKSAFFDFFSQEIPHLRQHLKQLDLYGSAEIEEIIH